MLSSVLRSEHTIQVTPEEMKNRSGKADNLLSGV